MSREGVIKHLDKAIVFDGIFRYFLIGGALLSSILVCFVGDFHPDGMPIFIIPWLSVLLMRIVLRVQVNLIEVHASFVVVVVFIFSAFRNVFVGDAGYSWFFFQTLTVINVIPLVKKVHEMFYRQLYIVTLVMLVGMIVVFVKLGLAYTGRLHFVFGPNVLYRLFGFISVVGVLSGLQWARSNGKFGALKVFVPVILGAYLAGMTFSRGALVVFAVIFFLALFSYCFGVNKSRLMRLLLFFALVPLLIVGFVLLVQWIQVNASRLLFFDVANNSEAQRAGALFMFKEYFWSGYVLFGSSASSEFIRFYPHNIVLEGFYYHGFFVGLMIIFMLAAYVFRVWFDPALTVFIPLVIGGLVSGSFQDNYPSLAVMSVALVRVFGALKAKGS